MNKYQVPSYYNEEQKQAIMLEHNNILVSASAGSGKTSLMIERIIRKIINDRLNITDLVVVTFTEAAAAELKERLEIALKKNIKQDQDHINKQLSLLSEAYISTFHSLCLRLLKESGATLSFDNEINIIPDLIKDSIKAKAFNILENKYYDHKDYQELREPFISVVDNNNKWHTIIDSYMDKIINNGGFNHIKNNHLLNIKQTNIFNYQVVGHLLYHDTLSLIEQISALIPNYEKWVVAKPARQEHVNTLINLIKSIKDGLDNKSYASIHQALINYQPNYRSFTIRESKTDDYYLLKIYHDTIKNIIKDNLKKYYFYKEDQFKYLFFNINKATINMIDYVKEYYEILLTIKKEEGLLEFNDLEQELIKILYQSDNSFSDKALKLKKQFQEIMIDEYQDTSLIQETIIKAISNDNVFMVGDLKQSIYSFRNATPRLFIEKYNEYQQPDNNNYLINLKYNYRSTHEVLDFANYIFKNLFTKELGGIDYEGDQELYFGNTSLNNDTYLYKTKVFTNISYDLMIKPSTKENYILTAKALTNEIIKLHNQHVPYRDITILVRNRTHIELLQDELDKYNIPYLLHSNNGFYENYEIKDLIALLKFLVNPKDDISLLAVLTSHFFNLNDNDLFIISLCEGKYLWHKLKNSNYQSIYHNIIDLLNHKKQLNPLELIDYIYDTTPYLAYFVNSTRYEKIQINILNFKNIISENILYTYDLENTLLYLSKNIKDKMDDATPSTISKEGDIINIMTIHKAKGLQFPYVMVFDNSKFNSRTSREIIFQENIIMDYYNNAHTFKIENMFKPLVKNSFKDNNIAETLRLLYVALTRAEKQLYLFINDTSDNLYNIIDYLEIEEDWLLPKKVVNQCKSINDLLIMALSRHHCGAPLRYQMDNDAYEEIFTYKHRLFSVEPYDFTLLDSQKQYHTPLYPIAFHQYETKLTNYQMTNIRPSQHQEQLLNFSNIKNFNTFTRGNITHHILEALDFKSPHIMDDLNKYHNQYHLSNKIFDGIESFIKSDLFSLIKNNDYYQEYSFSFYQDNNLVKGIIDLLVITKDEVYIIDYKSDNLDVSSLKEYYQSQLDIYESFIKLKYPHHQINKLIYSLINKTFIDLS
ncbi:MAG: UvrD-helicase domain-containing protein [Bacilli bacterium]|jgi:ATP-dependent helicase/nuclease subunit A|nr:UvrD-helicase domain-containing protein [Bacilli bacterium]